MVLDKIVKKGTNGVALAVVRVGENIIELHCVTLSLISTYFIEILTLPVVSTASTLQPGTRPWQSCV